MIKLAIIGSLLCVASCSSSPELSPAKRFVKAAATTLLLGTSQAEFPRSSPSWEERPPSRPTSGGRTSTSPAGRHIKIDVDVSKPGEPVKFKSTPRSEEAEQVSYEQTPGRLYRLARLGSQSQKPFNYEDALKDATKA
jgi:hypothetical protein